MKTVLALKSVLTKQNKKSLEYYGRRLLVITVKLTTTKTRSAGELDQTFVPEIHSCTMFPKVIVIIGELL
jgi:hypothetical protein